ncbi:hypothetical protein ACFLS9_06650 [Bacteroidota bacterium]
MNSKKFFIKTGSEEFDNLFSIVKGFLEKDKLDIVIDSKNISGYRSPDAKSIWIRDYSDMIRGFKYFEKDLFSTINHFAETQGENGRIFDYFTTFPEKLPCERENWTKYVRVPVEADVEYRFIKAAFLAWQASGDDEFILTLLPKMVKALLYIMNHPWYWEKKYNLVKRAYTIDTWDFAYTAGKHNWLQFQINKKTYWGIMHGDNSGYYQAFRIITLLCKYFNQDANFGIWAEKADIIKKAMNKICWNGKFYKHFVKLTPVTIKNVDEAEQLSLSNPMDINRGVTSTAQARLIIEEYIKRKESSDAFAEWFSIDPPFPDGIFGDDKLKGGAYVNGGIMPLVGGELAKAAFDNGYERYGVDILRRYYNLIIEKGETYLWYFPDGTPPTVDTSTSPEAEPTDGWGSSAMLYALVEGLAGVEDIEKLFQKVKLSPRWIAAGINSAEVQINYGSSGSSIGYNFSNKKNYLQVEVFCNKSDILFHILLPEKSIVKKTTMENKVIPHKLNDIGESRYVDFRQTVADRAKIKIELKGVR